GVRLKVSATAIWSAAASEARRRFGLCLCRIHLKTSLSSQSGVALRLPPHSIKSRSAPDSFKRLPSHTMQSPCDRAAVADDFVRSRVQWHTLPERMDLSATREGVLPIQEILHDGRDCLLQMANVQFIDSTGVGQLIQLQKKLRAIDRQLVLVAVCPAVQ